jgi:membrane protein
VFEASGGGLVPARPLEQITLADVRRAVSGDVPQEGGSRPEVIVEALAGAEGATAEALARWTYADLCARPERRRLPTAESAAGHA